MGTVYDPVPAVVSTVAFCRLKRPLLPVPPLLLPGDSTMSPPLVDTPSPFWAWILNPPPLSPVLVPLKGPLRVTLHWLPAPGAGANSITQFPVYANMLTMGPTKVGGLIHRAA